MTRPAPADPRLVTTLWAVALFVAIVPTRAAVIGHTLVNWDAVQYALGLTDFDVVRHQPHPPGSIIYEGLGRLVLPFTSDANRALSWIAVLAGAASVALCFVAGRAIFGPSLAWAGTALFAASPLTWFYGAVALPYSLEGALALTIVLLCWRALDRSDRHAAWWAAVVLAVAGGVRPTTLLLLLPLWVYSAALSSPRHRLWTVLIGAVLLGALSLLWAVPLAVLSGGVGRYVEASRQLSSLAGSQTSIFSAGLAGVGGTVQYIWDTASFGLNLGVVCFAVYFLPLRLPVRWPWRPTASQVWFLVLWAAPALAVFAFVHIGQAGYLLLIWPLACFATAQAALSVVAVLAARLTRVRSVASPAIIGTLCAASAALFLLSPARDSPAAISAGAIREQDAYWRRLVALAHELGPERAVVLTGTRSSESFRQASYYLPAFHVLAVGPDRDGTVGVAFQGFRGDHDYARFMAGGAATRRQPLSPGTSRLLILDASAAALFPERDLEELTVVPGRRLWRYPAGESSASLAVLTFPPQIEVERG